jgi:molecular chaperone DnaJ
VPTLNGGVKLKIPAGTPSGKTFRVRGKGVTPDRGRTGDLLVTVQVAVPSKVSKDEKRLLEELAAMDSDDVRSHLRT